MTIWDQIRAILYVECGLKPWEVDRLSNNDIRIYIEGYLNKRRQEIQTQMIAARFTGFLSILPYAGGKITSPKQLWLFGFEESDEIKPNAFPEKAQNLADKLDLEDYLAGRFTPGTPGYERIKEKLISKGLIDG